MSAVSSCPWCVPPGRDRRVTCNGKGCGYAVDACERHAEGVAEAHRMTCTHRGRVRVTVNPWQAREARARARARVGKVVRR